MITHTRLHGGVFFFLSIQLQEVEACVCVCVCINSLPFVASPYDRLHALMYEPRVPLEAYENLVACGGALNGER